ncbi:DUF3291 domain-containing protein [Kribbella sp. NPDC051586]|uniref:DUF3291 domain-containing protein n=1 Tax=Kribbella sp. NPDC051586 TaxID=3364118 RepID=UPI003794B656
MKGALGEFDGRQLAHANVSRLRYAADDARLAELMDAFAHVNQLAERAPGFVWRYPTTGAHYSLPDDPRTLLNVSVWKGYESLHLFVYRSKHFHYVRRTAEWFEPVAQPSTALWWVAQGTTPSPEEALAHIDYLRRYGPTPRAFSLRRRFAPDGRPEQRARRV